MVISDFIHTDIFRFLDDCVLDGVELLLLRERRTPAFSLGVKIFYLTLESPPHLIALADDSFRMAAESDLHFLRQSFHSEEVSGLSPLISTGGENMIIYTKT